MKRWWVGAAVAAVCVGQSAWAQQAPGDGGPLPEPAPVAASCPPGPQFVPGPLTSAGAPPGPGDALSLPASLPTAWGKGPIPESGAFLSIGGMGLQRQRPGGTQYARRDDTGDVVLNSHDLDPSQFWGGRLTFGYLYDDAALELTGFYIPENTTTVARSDINVTTLSTFFANLPGPFQGPDAAGLLARADRVALSLQTDIADAELNYRWWSRAFSGFEGILGFRYIEYQERARVEGDRDILLAQLTGITDRSLEATYTSRVHNHMLMGQFGYEWNYPVFCWLNAGTMFKSAFGADDVDIAKRIQRGDGVARVLDHSNHWTFTSAFEFNAFLDMVQFEKVRLRAGYTLLWLVHMDEALQQVNFNLTAPVAPNAHRDNGSVFLHGPMIELEFLF
jgi:hypothetical protein